MAAADRAEGGQVEPVLGGLGLKRVLPQDVDKFFPCSILS